MGRTALAGLRRLLDWRAWLVYTHRWLGIVGCLLFIAWFFSGIVMMYARMPELAPEEQLARAAPLDVSRVRVTPADVLETTGARAQDITLGMLGDRPVYRVGRRAPTVVYADDGEFFAGLDLATAEARARVFEPGYAGLYRGTLMDELDQWTLQAEALMPMYRFILDDAAGTHLYVSDVTGDVVLRTTRRDRFWGYLGPVTHWLYFAPLRRNGAVWFDTVVWSSLVGCVMCVAGLVWGVLRFSPSARFRLKRQRSMTPYAGMMRWHHYAGLLFGVLALTWAYSGLLSMQPFGWFEPSGGRARRAASSTAPESADALSVEQLRSAHAVLSRTFPVKEMQLAQVGGVLYWAADRAPEEAEADRWRSPGLLPREYGPRLERLYVSALRPDTGTFTSFPRALMEDVARAQVDARIEAFDWIDRYDGYYYDPASRLPLPVLRVKFCDAAKTWVYVDPTRGGVVRRSEDITRMQRWLYQGLHSLDFPFLYYRRPLWDVVAIVLSLGGLAISLTTVTPAWRRLVRHAHRAARVVARPWARAARAVR